MKIKVTYLYRDGSNYKFWGSFVVEGKLELKDVEEYLFDLEFFIAHEIGLEHLLDMPLNQDDHYLHTFESFEIVDEGKPICTASEFIERIKSANEKDWFSSFSSNMIPEYFKNAEHLS